MYISKPISLTVISVMIVGLLSGCGSEPITFSQEKTSFQIQTVDIYDTKNTSYITKSSKIQGTSEIMISSLVPGRVRRINHQIGSQVSQGGLLVQLQDMNTPYVFTVDGGSTTRNIREAELALERFNITDQTTRNDILLQQQKLDYNLQNVDGTRTGSNTQIQLSKLELDLARAEFDYQARLKSDDQTSNNFLTNIQNIQSDLKLLVAETLNETDKVLGITDKYINDLNYRDMRVYIGAKKPELRSQITSIFYDLKAMEDGLAQMQRKDITLKTIDQILTTYANIVLRMGDLFVVMKENFIYSIDDARYQAQIDMSANMFTVLSSRASGLNSSITSQINASRSYFVSYGDQQSSLAKQIESLRSQIGLTKKSLDDAKFDATIGAQRSQIGFENQLQNLSLNNESALLQLTQARFDQSKFLVNSPLRGVVADILVDLGQEISPGTPLMKIISNQQQIELSLTTDEIKNIRMGQKVIIESELGNSVGTIAQIAKTVDQSGSFKIIVVISQASTIPTGLFVTVKIPVQDGVVLLPINALFLVDTNLAIAYFWDGEKIVPQTLRINSIFGEQVEISDSIPTDYQLITSDVTNYDDKTMTIVLKK